MNCLRVIAVAFLIMAISMTAKAASDCQQTFRVGLIFHEPLYFLDSNKKPQGSSYEVVQELKRRTGCAFVIDELSRPSVMERFRMSRIDFNLIAVKSDGLDQVADFVRLYKSPRGIVFNADLSKKATTFQEALKNPKVVFATVIGTKIYFRDKEWQDLIKQKRLVEFPDYNGVFTAMEKGRVQVFVGSLMISSYFMKQFDGKNFSLQEDNTFMSDIGAYVHKKRVNAADLQLLKTTLSQMVQDGSFQKIYSKYSNPDVAKKSIIP